MRKRLLLVLTFALVASSVSAQSGGMLAEITAPVQTPFGTYVPTPASIHPCLQPLQVADDFSNVVNFDRFDFSGEELQLLRKNHFVVVPGHPAGQTGPGAFREMVDVYNEARELGIPILVTSDALLHTFHLVFDRILMTLETRRFYGWLDGLLRALYD